jgi:serine/threonine protein phosphatase PrpC
MGVYGQARAMALTYQVAAKTDVGCVRANNEDNFGFDKRHGIFVVCDGMGGQAAGEVASKLAVDTVLNFFRRSGRNSTAPGKQYPGVSSRANALAAAIQMANSAIHAAAARDAEHSGMGSTIVAVLAEEDGFSIAHVGDSRIYLIRGDEIQQLTNDHSLVMEQVRRGYMTREEAQRSELHNIIIRALGPEDTVEPDLGDLAAQPGDILLLTTDGLTGMVADEEILRIAKSAPSLDKVCEELIGAAREAGGPDNITCLLLRATEKAWYQRMVS